MTVGATTIDGGVRLRWAHPDEFDRGWALHLLGTAERSRAVGTAPGGLRDRFLLGRMLLRELAAEVGGIRPDEVGVAATCERCGAEHGRPRLVWPDAAGPPPFASLASCGDLVVAAVAPAGVAVGIDVEPRRAGESRYTEAGRRQAVADLIGGPRRTSIRRWVRIEAVLKADGRGLRVAPSAVAFDDGGARIADRSTSYRIVDRRIDGCLVSVAVAAPG